MNFTHSCGFYIFEEKKTHNLEWVEERITEIDWIDSTWSQLLNLKINHLVCVITKSYFWKNSR